MSSLSNTKYFPDVAEYGLHYLKRIVGYIVSLTHFSYYYNVSLNYAEFSDKSINLSSLALVILAN
jgi:hypothetical protein